MTAALHMMPPPGFAGLQMYCWSLCIYQVFFSLVPCARYGCVGSLFHRAFRGFWVTISKAVMQLQEILFSNLSRRADPTSWVVWRNVIADILNLELSIPHIGTWSLMIL